MRTFDDIHECFEGDVQYPYADIGVPELLHISSVTPETRRAYTYICPACHKALRPRLGKKNRHCFFHEKGTSCDQDRYIHETAIRLLKEKWDSDLPFEITMEVHRECKYYDSCVFHEEGIPGCLSCKKVTYDLKQHFNQCVVEKKFGEFIPDLCLIDDSGKHEPIFIEIWSKHKNSEKKADSAYRIIEIRLKTIEELEELPLHPITESGSVTFSHFPKVLTTPTRKDGLPLRRYTLYAGSLKAFVDEKNVYCGNYRENHHPKAVFEMVCSQDDIGTAQKFRSLCNAVAIERGYDIRSCYLCRQYGRPYETENEEDAEEKTPIQETGCRRDYKNQGLIACNPDDARSCQHFLLRENQLKKSKAFYLAAARYIWEKKEDGSCVEENHQRILNRRGYLPYSF